MSRQGRHGEWKFGEICTGPDANAEAVVNKASDDQHGWDHILEIVPPSSPMLPADLQAHVLQCFVQIKTTQGKSPKTRLKLSNAVKAAKSPLPSFVFLLQYHDRSSRPKIFGRHIWASEIEHWLKRARETETEGSQDLHKLSATMSFSEADCIQQNPVDWVLTILSQHGGENYAKRKLKLINSVGYEQYSHEGTVTFGPLDSAADVVLHELGLKRDLPFKDLRLYDRRFGIKSMFPVNSFSTGRIRFRKV
ncbi:hypothetical protein [Roseovarius sp. A46]|uniref:hypothetical protein n=1 Tax=Roseovarius sp. A46 TaxID=2109331 RepID=UPI0010115A18|nr:hypothetical protein [Roseovarius sp. A46]